MSNRREIITRVLTDTDGVAPRSNSPLSKHVKMAASPFRFMRGSAPLYYRDLAERTCNLIPEKLFTHIPRCLIQGDCHISNFGFITEEGSHGDQVVFSLNDFDDACVGHAVWDLLRFATSLQLSQDYLCGLTSGLYAGKNSFQGDAPAPSEQDAVRAVMAFLRAYLSACEDSIGDEKTRHTVVKRFKKDHFLYPLWKKARKRAAGGKNFSSKSSLAKAARWSDGDINFDLQNSQFKPLGVATSEALKAHFAPFMDDCVLDVIERLDAGTGSVNMTRYYFLVGPERGQYPDDLHLCHIVEVKQQRHAAALAYFRELNPMNRLNPAHLTQVCQQRMQRHPDLILDETEWQGAHWLVRSRHHAKVGIDPEDLLVKNDGDESAMETYAAACGRALALAHSRADRRSTRFEQAVCFNLPEFYEVLADASLTLAEKTRGDWVLLKSILNG